MRLFNISENPFGCMCLCLLYVCVCVADSPLLLLPRPFYLAWLFANVDADSVRMMNKIRSTQQSESRKTLLAFSTNDVLRSGAHEECARVLSVLFCHLGVVSQNWFQRQKLRLEKCENVLYVRLNILFFHTHVPTLAEFLAKENNEIDFSRCSYCFPSNHRVIFPRISLATKWFEKQKLQLKIH